MLNPANLANLEEASRLVGSKTLLSEMDEGARLRARIAPHELAACDVDGDGVVDMALYRAGRGRAEIV